jgi:hypothetical protein
MSSFSFEHGQIGCFKKSKTCPAKFWIQYMYTYHIRSYHVISHHITSHHVSYHIIYHISHIIFHISFFIYHISYIIFHISFFIYHISYIISYNIYIWMDDMCILYCILYSILCIYIYTLYTPFSYHMENVSTPQRHHWRSWLASKPPENYLISAWRITGIQMLQGENMRSQMVPIKSSHPDMFKGDILTSLNDPWPPAWTPGCRWLGLQCDLCGSGGDDGRLPFFHGVAAMAKKNTALVPCKSSMIP